MPPNQLAMRPSTWVSAAIVILVIVVAGYLLFVTNPPAFPLATYIAGTSTPPAVSSTQTTNTSQPLIVANSPHTKAYVDPSGTVSLEYIDPFAPVPVASSGTQTWMTNATTTGTVLLGLELPSAALPNTNFAGAQLTVGDSSDRNALTDCLTYNPIGGPTSTSMTVSINGVVYKRFMSSDAGAGNFYNTTSYRTIHDGKCFAIEYTIHSTNLYNYPASMHIAQFDANWVEAHLEAIVQTIKFLK